MHSSGPAKGLARDDFPLSRPKPAALDWLSAPLSEVPRLRVRFPLTPPMTFDTLPIPPRRQPAVPGSGPPGAVPIPRRSPHTVLATASSLRDARRFLASNRSAQACSSPVIRLIASTNTRQPRLCEAKTSRPDISKR